MGKKASDPTGNDQVWRRLLALVKYTKRSERSFALWCEINYNQWNNYKRKKKFPSQPMVRKIMRRTGVRYEFIADDNWQLMPRELDEALTEILKEDQ